MHHNHYFAVFLIFLLAQFIHLWFQAKGKIGSKLNGIESYKQYLDNYGTGIWKRMFFNLGCYLVWTRNPDILTNAANCSTWVSAHVGRVNLGLDAATAFLVGYILDSFIDKLPVVFPWLRPWFGQEVPLPRRVEDSPKANAA